MIRVEPCRRVMMAVHTRPSMRPITTQRGSSCVRAGTSRWSSSSHSAFASAKSIPCLAKFEADLLGSKSNRAPKCYTETSKRGYELSRRTADGPDEDVKPSDGRSPSRCSRVQARKALRAVPSLVVPPRQARNARN